MKTITGENGELLVSTALSEIISDESYRNMVFMELGGENASITALLEDKLNEINAEVHIFELDRELIPGLRRKLNGIANLHIHNDDIKNFDEYCNLKGRRLGIIADSKSIPTIYSLRNRLSKLNIKPDFLVTNTCEGRKKKRSLLPPALNYASKIYENPQRLFKIGPCDRRMSSRGAYRYWSVFQEGKIS